MSEILAYAAAFFEECLNRSRDLRRFRVEAEILVDSSREIANRLQQRTSGGKRIVRIRRQFRTRPDALRIENELVGVEDFHASLAFQRLRHCLPRRGSGEIRRLDGLHLQFAARLHGKAAVRLSQREECQHIPEIIDMRDGTRRYRSNGYLASTTSLPWKIARCQAQDVMRDRDRVFIVVCSYVPDLINQVARSNSSA